MKKVIVLLLLLLSLSGFCRKVSFIVTNPNAHYNRIDYKDVAVFLNESQLPKDAIMIGYIICNDKKERKTVNVCKKVAAKHGGNAIMYTSGGKLKGGEKIANTLLWPGIYKTGWHYTVYYIPDKKIVE